VGTSYNLFSEAIPDSKPTGVYVDKHGNYEVVVNIPFQINVEKDGAKGEWEPIRFVFATCYLKGKFNVIERGENPKYFKKTILGHFETLSISQLVIKDDEGEELESEQTIVQYLANIQLEKLRKDFKW
jgi:hypothetical protein